MLKETLAVVEKGIKAGKTLGQLKQENVLAPWQKWNGDFITAAQWLITLYNDLYGSKAGRIHQAQLTCRKERGQLAAKTGVL
jgi:hypothetical protein